MNRLFLVFIFAFSAGCQVQPTQADSLNLVYNRRALSSPTQWVEPTARTSPTPTSGFSLIQRPESPADEGPVQKKKVGGMFCADYIARKVRLEIGSELDIGRRTTYSMSDQENVPHLQPFFDKVDVRNIV